MNFLEKKEQRPTNCISAKELQRQADMEQSSYLFEKYQYATTALSKNMETMLELDSLAFKFIIMLTYNFYLSSNDNQSTIQAMLKEVSRNTEVFGIFLAYLFLGLLCVNSWSTTYSKNVWIRYAPLYEKTLKQIEKVQKNNRY